MGRKKTKETKRTMVCTHCRRIFGVAPLVTGVFLGVHGGDGATCQQVLYSGDRGLAP